ncbi:hypothetical protein LWI29_010493 [Acer saccharum]|uniref:Uncharacterized protein n=1 Tax=Acer saccharum TaxID=4024 RepID=A0AA39SX71_ACESA|nr:hypothetical protein LWI29_010493 [Acer saccharum]
MVAARLESRGPETITVTGKWQVDVEIYIWSYKTNFDNLKTEARNLEVKRDAILHLIDEARRNGNWIEQYVSDWLDHVKTVTDEASEVIKENERANMNVSSYQQSRSKSREEGQCYCWTLCRWQLPNSFLPNHSKGDMDSFSQRL